MANGLVPPSSSVKVSDGISGRYRGAGFTAIKARLVTHTLGGSTRTDYRGLLIAITLPRPLAGRTLLAKAKARVSWLDFWGKPEHRVVTGDAAFDGVFAAYSTDRPEAQALLTVPLRGRLLDVAAKLRSARFRVAFLRDRMLVAAPVLKNLLEGGPITLAVGDSRRAALFLGELDFLYGLVAALDAPT